MHTQDFLTKFVKGKIAEALFEKMFSESGSYAVIPSGYEHTIPIVAQFQHQISASDVLNTLKKSPDFILQSEDKRQIWFVEVKYNSSSSNFSYLQQQCLEIASCWPHTHIFIATPNGFFFDDVKNISKGLLPQPLRVEVIPMDVQEKYLKVLNDFIH